MFTGLVAALGEVVDVQKRPSEMELQVAIPGGHDDPIGASIALSGVCCTVTAVDGPNRTFVLTAETLRRTTLGRLQPGDLLNIERPLRTGDPYGGHVVQGHVDGVGEIVEAVGSEGGEWRVRLPQDLCRYCVEKGSIALDGVSLTIAAIDDDEIMVAIIPHTAAVTTIGRHPQGHPVNIEVDILAKYVERLLEAHKS